MSTQEQQKRLPPPVATEWRLKDLTWPDPRVGGSRRTVKIICQVRRYFLRGLQEEADPSDVGFVGWFAA
jgi:hypothetical protein